MEKILFLFCGLLVFIEGRVPNYFGSRIVNGVPVKQGEIPYQVSLQYGSSHFCGGSIVNEKYIVTASHCVSGESPANINVAVGTIYYKTPSQKLPAERIIMHKDYSPSDSYKNDIALIKVSGSFVFNDNVKSVLLPEQNQFIKPNSSAVVSGWGYHGYGSHEIPSQLFKAKISVADPDYCRETMKDAGMKIHKTNICAYDPTVRRGQCNGDSGGPLTVDGKLVGIVSWSIKDPYCASTKYPGVYTRVTEFVDWINENTKL